MDPLLTLGIESVPSQERLDSMTAQERLAYWRQIIERLRVEAGGQAPGKGESVAATSWAFGESL